MAVKFRCPCGAILSAGDDRVDAVLPCPHCHSPLRVPHPALDRRDCVLCKKTIPSAHTIWVRGRRICRNCMPPGSVHIDMKAFEEHRRLQFETIKRAKAQGLRHYQYLAPDEAAHNEIQNTADELVLEERDWSNITQAWREHGLFPFDMGSFMGVSLNVERFRAQAEESMKYLPTLLAYVKLADELPLASVPKEAVAKT